ncbi:hypothetical protein ACFL0R_05795 [Pseudomonadota bacterium]
MGKLKKILLGYFVCIGVGAHMFALVLVVAVPDLVHKAYAKGMQWATAHGYNIAQLDRRTLPVDLALEIKQVFGSWEPIAAAENGREGIWIGDTHFSSLKNAAQSLKAGQTLEIGEGVYHEPLVLEENDVVVRGLGHVVLEGAVAQGKAAIITKGNNIHIENIECRGIKVKDKNGACVRHEGRNLKLVHVYFHSSEAGLLSGAKGGRIEILDSRFERLGRQGQAHGVYIGGGELIIRDSRFIASVDEGHEIKSRAELTFIDKSVIASLSSEDSRLLDIPNGGRLIVTNSILQQGLGSSNQDAIGYGLENASYTDNTILLKNNIIILERHGRSQLIHAASDLVRTEAINNIVVSSDPVELPGFNLIFESRQEAGLPDYPALPAMPGTAQ